MDDLAHFEMTAVGCRCFMNFKLHRCACVHPDLVDQVTEVLCPRLFLNTKNQVVAFI